MQHLKGPVSARQAGFTLVELSIVLVILGLLVGGVLSGQSLIHAAELRAISTEHDKYIAATQTFHDKYFALPGDMTNATAFWGKNNTACSTNTGTAATPGTCNGDGDGSVSITSTGAAATAETFQFWNQLALGGLIEGTYTGVDGTAADFAVAGTNVPKSKASNGAWAIAGLGSSAGDTSAYAGNYGNALMFGTAGANLATTANLKPEDAWNIDTKIDDGKPGTGTILARYWNNACATSTSNTDYTGNYNLSNSAIACALYFTNAF